MINRRQPDSAPVGSGATSSEALPFGSPAPTWSKVGVDGTPVEQNDLLGRPMSNLRISVTDRCNLRCNYCMPEDKYSWLPRRDLLSFEEIARLTGIFSQLGVRHVRLTGGEPLLRSNLHDLVQRLTAQSRIESVTLTTNGVLLAQQAEPLRRAGLSRVTISLDTLIRSRYRSLTRRDDHDKVLRSIEAVQESGLAGTKLNVVLMRGFNDDELEKFIAFGRETALEVRFIEYMDVGGATHWNPATVVPRSEILKRMRRTFGSVTAIRNGDTPGAPPAERFQLEDGTIFGVIASTTRPFCGSCNRSRLTADGTWFRCLYASAGTNLRRELRSGRSSEELAHLIAGTWRERDDRGAQERLLERERRPLADAPALRANPHLEMHTRGG